MWKGAYPCPTMNSGMSTYPFSNVKGEIMGIEIFFFEYFPKEAKWQQSPAEFP